MTARFPFLKFIHSSVTFHVEFFLRMRMNRNYFLSGEIMEWKRSLKEYRRVVCTGHQYLPVI